MTPTPASPAVDDEDPDKSPVRGNDGPTPVRRKEDQDSTTKEHLPGDNVQPRINEATADPN